MQQRPKILNIKLTAVESANSYKRRRLIDQLGCILQKKIALVTAGAGWGKTTLIAQTVGEMEWDKVWYRLDESDNDFATFMRYLVAGIQKNRPPFGAELQKYLASSRVPSKIRERLLLEFLAEIEKSIPGHLIIVLDDFHMVQDNPEIAGSMDFLLRLTPPNLHWVVASRMEPKLPVSSHRARLEVIDLGETDLSFRMDEIAAFFKLARQAHIPESALKKLAEKTGGWAAGLILYFNSLQNNPSAAEDERLFQISQSDKFIFQYLEENIFCGLADGVKEFMLRSSLLSRLDPEFCDELFGRGNSREILNTLYENHLFTFPCQDESHVFEYHQLMRDFLRDRLYRTIGKDQIDVLHHSIGKLMEHTGDIPGAMNHYLQGGHFEDLSGIIRGLMFTDLLECPLPFLTKIFERLPGELITNDARLLYIWAKLSSLKGELGTAIKGFQNTLERLHEDGDPMGTANCRKDLGFHYYLTGDVHRARAEMQQLCGRPHEDPFFSFEVGGYLILFASILGKMEEADDYYASFNDSLAGNANHAERSLFSTWLNLCYSNRLHHSGDFDKAHRLNMSTLDAFTSMGMEVFLPLANFQAALTSFYLVSPEQGYRYALDGLSAAARVGINDHQYAWLLYARALNSPGNGETESALGIGHDALDIFSMQKNVWGQACVLELLGMIHNQMGEPAEAEAFLRRGLAIIGGRGLMGTESALALGLARVLIDGKDFGGAHKILQQHQKEIQISKFHKFVDLFLHARIDHELGEREKSLRAAHKGLQLAAENNYSAWIIRESSWMAPILMQCYAHSVSKRYIEAILDGVDRKTRNALLLLRKDKDHRIRCAADDLIAVLPKSPCAPLTIKCLGQFEVLVGDTQIPQEQWRSSAAQKIFKYLVLKLDQGFTPKEVLLELAWPGEDPAKTSGRLHVALNALRKLFEPELKRGLRSSYIMRRGDSYRLDIGETGTVDVHRFRKNLQLAESTGKEDNNEALCGYLKAEALYGGPLFVEDPYEDWFAAERERLQTNHLTVLQKIIELYETKGAWKDCIDYAEKYLIIDPYAEGVYCALMNFHSQSRQTSHIIKTFKRCKEFIQDDLGCPISAGTIALFRSLINQ